MIIEIEARPEPVAIDIRKTAVVVVDMQNDFGADGGMFARAGLDISPIRNVVAPIQAVLESTRRAGVPIIYLKMGYHADLADTGGPDAPTWVKHSNSRLNIGQPTIAPNGEVGRILIRDTWNTEILDELRPEPDDLVLYKTRYSGFYGTNLHSTLRDKRVRNLIIVGCTTAVCVESTIRDATFRDYHCILPEDCTAEPIRRDFPATVHESSLEIIAARFGWITQSEKLLQAFREVPWLNVAVAKAPSGRLFD